MTENIARVFLVFVGLAYVALGIWCAAAPATTSKSVGFDLQPGQGQSEFLTVYGGLEVGLGLLFLRPLYKREEIDAPLTACVTIHACLVLFRSIGFFTYTNFPSTTYLLAATEWSIFLGAAALCWLRRDKRE